MRRVAWVMVLVMAAVAAPYASAGRAAAQPTTVPFPDFDHDGFGDLAVGYPARTWARRSTPGRLKCCTVRRAGWSPTGEP